MTDQLQDSHGHLWPVTGAWCDTCGWPLIPTDGHTTHPTCESGEANG